MEAIVGIDVKEPARSVGKFTFYNRDVRTPIDDIIEKHSIDTVIHAAFILPPIHDQRLMDDVNINGTRSVLDSCVRGGVKQVLYTSSATAYGFHADNDRPLTEESPCAARSTSPTPSAKRIIEGIFRSTRGCIPESPSQYCGPASWSEPGFDNPLARYVRMRLSCAHEKPSHSSSCTRTTSWKSSAACCREKAGRV